MKRVATSLVLIPLVTWLILGAPHWAFAAALAIIGLLAFHEYDRIAGGLRIPRAGFPGMVVGLALMFAPAPETILVLAAMVALMLALRAPDLKDALSGGASFVLGVVYIFGAWRCAVALRIISPHWLMFGLLLSWAGDTAALYVGKAFGRHKLAPRVSPGKTWEGAIGSVVAGVLAGWAYAHYFLPETPVALVLALASAGNLAGQMGDLCESALKRGAGVKDSGASLPGHGGWLDRVDSCLFSIPVVYALLSAYLHKSEWALWPGL